MAACYICGAPGADYRREVYTGSSSGWNWGKRVSLSSRRYYGVRTVCADCAAKIDESKKNGCVFSLVILIIIAIIGIGIVFNKSTTSSNSSDNSTNSSSVNPILMQGDVGRIISLKGLNVRKEPNVNSDILTTIPYNETIHVLNVVGGDGKWYEVNYNGINGYILSRFVEKTE